MRKRGGLVLSQEVAEYLIHHLQRDMRVLMRVLKQLDSLSMREQRRLTIPFIKKRAARDIFECLTFGAKYRLRVSSVRDIRFL